MFFPPRLLALPCINRTTYNILLLKAVLWPNAYLTDNRF
nr:MAG TPA: hypothetical protein [Caudoviricetes sp.]